MVYNHASLDADMENLFDFNGGVNSPTSALDPLHSMIAPEHADERQVFSGPSHEYGRFKQQTGLPSGAMSAIPTFTDMGGDNDFMSQPGAYASTSGFSAMDMGYNSGFNLDMDYESSPRSAMPGYYFPGVTSDMQDFPESSSAAAHSNPPRLWPGMHSQQAEQARAEANARQQRQQQQGQQIMEQRQREQSASASSQQSSGSRKTTRAGSQATSDPVADERISRILDQMRHNSTVSTIEEESNAADEAAARSAKLRKEEEDMDEDERLLASEEGKKLSSKERRQLRNKVSARAFRSRRKEYITQLEGEVAAKANECNELRLNTRKLTEENAQLKHLTRTLLSHPAFQTFLEDMSRDPNFIAPTHVGAAQQGGPAPSNENHQGREGTKQEDMTGDDNQMQMGPMPQSSLNLSMLNLGNNHWGAQNAGGFNFQPQVFSVLDVPEGPSYEEIMAPRISSKPKEVEIPARPVTARKVTAPKAVALPTILEAEDEAPALDWEEDASDDLYAESTPPTPRSTCTSTSTITTAARLLENSLSGKPSPPHFAVTVTRNESSEELVEQVEALFESVEPSMERLRRLT